MGSFNLSPFITRPTRIGMNDSLSTIDHIWANNNLVSNSGIFLADITDHFPVFCSLLLPTLKKGNNTVKIQFRDMSEINEMKFTEMLLGQDWSEYGQVSLNPHLGVASLTDKIDSFFNECFPMKTKFISVKRLMNKWLSKGIITSINVKHNLY